MQGFLAYSIAGPMFFFGFRRARALDLGSTLPKEHVFFSVQRAHWIIADSKNDLVNFRR